MVSTVQGMVLHHISFGESSVIAQVYTDLYGRLSVMINNIRGKRSKFSLNMLRPLSVVEMELYYKQSREIQRVREISNPVQFHNIPYRIEKSTQVMFMAEILYKTLREEEANASMFGFLVNAVQVFDLQERNTGSFHIVFMIELSRFLGFFPRNNFSDSECFFDLRNGQFAARPLEHPDYLDKKLSGMMHRLLSIKLKDLDRSGIRQLARTGMTEALVDYYSLHISGFGKVRSLPVLKEVLA